MSDAVSGSSRRHQAATDAKVADGPTPASSASPPSSLMVIPIFAVAVAAAAAAAVLQRSGYTYLPPVPVTQLRRLLLHYTGFGGQSSAIAHVSPTDIQLYDSSKPLLVYWYDSTRCDGGDGKRCQTLHRTYDTFAARAVERNLPVQIMSVDCRTYRTECDSMDVTSFPTLSWYRDGEAVDVKSPALKPHMDWNAVTVDALWGYARKKIDEGSCPLYDLVGEGAAAKKRGEEGRGDPELPSPPEE